MPARRHGAYNTPEYYAWIAMKARCYNPNNRKFRIYGGRGIAVCARWLQSFENFIADMGPRPGKGYSLDRMDSDGNYEPDNCRWATLLEQNNNTKSNTRAAYDGRTQTLGQWAREFGISYQMVVKRMGRGWTIERALTTPSLKGNRNEVR